MEQRKIDVRGVSKAVWIIVAIALIIVAGVIGYIIPKPSPAEKPPIKIGLATSLTGVCAPYGEHYLKGARLLVDEINSAGGLLGGRMIKLVVEDTEAKPEVAVTVMRKLVLEDGCKLICGPYTSAANFATQEWLAEQGVLNVIQGAWNPQLTYNVVEEGYNLFFRICVNSELISQQSLTVLKEHGAHRIAHGAYDEPWGHSAVEYFSTLEAEMGLETVRVEYFDRGTTDYYPVLRSFKEANPDTLIMSMEIEDAKVFYPQLKELGLHETVSWIYDTVDLEDLLPEYAEAMEGIMWTTYFDARFPATTKAEEFVNAWKAMYGYYPIAYDADGYDAPFVITEAIKEAGTDDPEVLASVMEEMTFHTAIGDLEFDEYHQFQIEMFLLIVEEGEVVIVE